MKTVTLGVAGRDEVRRRAREAFKGKKQGARISFATPELLFRLLSAKRWQLVRAMAGSGPLSIREAARRVGRDVKAVHGDVKALLAAGVLQKTTDGRIVFPFDAIRVDMLLRAA
jgi:predicted transcriptional regulator